MLTPARSQQGFALIEALVTVLIVVFGLLGLVGLQTRMSIAEMESYQRAQALVLASDMAQRIAANPKGAACYAGQSVGNGAAPATSCTLGTAPATGNVADIQDMATADLAAWDSTLEGAAEKKGSNNVGAMLGARGCILNITPVGATFTSLQVAVAWQGLSKTAAVDSGDVPCGAGQYTAPGDGSASDAVRRVITVGVTVANLEGI